MKKYDKNGAEQLLGPIIFVVSFLGITLILVASMSEIQYVASMPDQQELNEHNIFSTFDINMTLYEPKSGVYIGNCPILTNYYWNHLFKWWAWWDRSYGMAAEFVPPGNSVDDDTNFWIYIIRNNTDYSPAIDNIEWKDYKDMIYIYHHCGWIDEYEDFISFDEIIKNEANNMSFVQVKLDKTYTLVVRSIASDKNDSFTERLDDLDVILYFGRSFDDLTKDMAQSNVFTVIGQMLTFQLPDTPAVISVIIGIPVWICIIFIIFTLIIRVIPTIPGG